jgi:ribonucleoside-triphosphate reductase
MNIEFISNDFVQNVVRENPKPLNELGEFVYYRTYSRWLEHRGRREFWHETVKRAIEYNMALGYKHMRDIGYKINLKEMKEEAEKLFKNIYETKQFPSGRTLWLGNANEKVNKDFVLGNFNCSFLTITKWDDLVDLFYLLMVGCGVGLKSTKKMAANMPKIKVNTKLLHSEYKPVPVEQRLENTKVVKMDNGFAKIYVGDSKNGWVEALREYFYLLTKPENEDIHTIKISYNSVRPRGERLKTFGGTASGHQPLMEMFEGIDKVFKNQIDPDLSPIEADEKGYGHVRPIHILDIANFIGANVVVGGVRRTSEIFLFDADDYESMFAKYGINGLWTEEQLQQHKEVGKILDAKGIKPKWFDDIKAIGDARKGLDHRRMSNNSVAFTKKPSREDLHLQFLILKGEGEPCFVNLEEAARRVAKAIGYKKPSRSLLESIMVAIGLNPLTA